MVIGDNKALSPITYHLSLFLPKIKEYNFINELLLHFFEQKSLRWALVAVVIQIQVWLIPLVLVGTILGMYALILSWQKQTQQDLKSLQADLRNFQTKFKQFEIATQGFSVEDREPFGSDMRTLSVQLDMLGRRRVSCMTGT